MYCRECGKEFPNDLASICLECGVKKGHGNKFCQGCGTEKVNPSQEVCLKCGAELKGISGNKTKIIALLLALFLGGFGAHLFYVGKTGKAILYILLTIGGVVTCGITSIAAFVLQIIDIVYICTDKFIDSKGNILSD